MFPVRLSIINITQVKSFENGHLVDIWWTFGGHFAIYTLKQNVSGVEIYAINVKRNSDTLN